MKISALIIVFVICSSTMLFGQNKKVDSLLTLLKTDKPDTIRVNYYIDLCDAYSNSNPDTAMYFGNLGLKLALKVNFKKGIANCYNNIGLIYANQGNYPEALKNFFVSLKLVPKGSERTSEWKKITANTYSNIGLIYANQGNYPEALKNFLATLRISEEIGDKKGISDSYNDIGNVYTYYSNFPEALKNYFASLKIDQELGDKKGIAIEYNNIGNNYYDQSGHQRNQDSIGFYYKLALKYFVDALKIREAISDKEGIADSHNDIGVIYKNQAQYQQSLDSIKSYYYKALTNHFASLKLREEMGDKDGIAESFINLGLIYTKLHKLKEAADYLNKALSLGKQIGNKDRIKESYNAQTDLDSVQGNWKLAYKHHNLFIIYRDSLKNEETQKKTIQSEMTYEFEKKEASIKAEHDKQITIAAAESRKQKIIIWCTVLCLLLVLIFFIVLFRLFLQKKKANIILAQQKEEISTQRDEIEAQRDLVTEQKDHIEEIHKKVTDSINYAKRIQEAVLPVSVMARSVLGDHFILFKPKDVVSGDFYWTTKIENLLIVVVADCTGHGVPGAFMSMLGISFLTEIVNKKEVTQASHVLNHLRIEIINALQQKGTSGEQKDGMDMSLVVINISNNQLQYSGANNPLFIVTAQRELKVIEADKMPVAIHEHMENFTNHEYQLQKGDCIYLASDGYEDQFGGPKNRKFMAKQLKELFVTISDKPMNKQLEILDKTFENWRGEHEQIDDVTVMGLRI